MERIWCFDLWYTLIEPSSAVARTYADALVDACLDRNVIFPFVRDYCMTKKYSYQQLAELACSRFSISDSKVVREVATLWKNENQYVQWIGQAKEILDELRLHGENTVLITNTTFAGWEDVDAILDIGSRFSRLILSCEQGIAKPDPRMFVRVMEYFPCARPEQFVMIGDSEEHDCLVPCSLGWKTILVERGIDHVLD